MRRIDRAILVLLLSLSAAAEGNGQDKPPTPAEQYQALRKEYDRASGSSVPLTDAERLKFVGQVYKHRHALALRGRLRRSRPRKRPCRPGLRRSTAHRRRREAPASTRSCSRQINPCRSRRFPGSASGPGTILPA